MPFRRFFRRFPLRRRVMTRRRPLYRRPVRPTTFRRRVSRFRGSVSRPGGPPFGPYYLARLLYGEPNMSLESTAGSVAQLYYRLNSLYDPRYAVGGGQPRYFDTFCGPTAGNAPYAAYIVYGCKVVCTFINDTSYSGYVAISASNSSSNSPATLVGLQEHAATKIRHITKDGGDNSSQVLSWYVKIPSIMGVTKRQYLDQPSVYGAAYSADPSSTCYLTVTWIPDTAQDADIKVDIKLKFYCKFYYPNLVDAS